MTVVRSGGLGETKIKNEPSEELSYNHRVFIFGSDYDKMKEAGFLFCEECDRPRIFKDGSCSFCAADELGD